MDKKEELKTRIKNSLQLILFPQDKTLLEEIAESLVQRIVFIDSLDNSYAPLDELVQELYQQTEQALISYKQLLLTNPENAMKFLRSKTQKDLNYEVLGQVVERLLNKETQDYFIRQGLQSRYFAHNSLASFSSARKLFEEKKIEIGVAIGPEGFSYAGFFELLGLPVKKIYINEYCLTENRPYKELDNLSIIKSKHTLFIEDDVKTGQTLKKAYQKIMKYSPASVSVYLGIPESRQNLQSVPKEFKRIYVTPDHLPDGQKMIEIDITKQLLEKKYSIFKK